MEASHDRPKATTDSLSGGRIHLQVLVLRVRHHVLLARANLHCGCRVTSALLRAERPRATVFGQRLPAGGRNADRLFRKSATGERTPAQTQRILCVTAVELEMHEVEPSLPIAIRQAKNIKHDFSVSGVSAPLRIKEAVSE